MARENREWYPGSIHHITARGNRKSDLFIDEKDYIIYLAIVRETKNKLPFELYSYCLMTNHVHLEIKTFDIGISDIMKRINQVYAQYFNKRYNYVGHLFQDRYGSKLIETDLQVLTTSRYIHLNPVRAKMVEKPEDYPWSSYSMFIGKKKEKLISPQKILSYYNDANNRELYKKFVVQI